MKNFVKVMNKEDKVFQYIKQNFSNQRETNIKGGIFVGPQIREILKLTGGCALSGSD